MQSRGQIDNVRPRRAGFQQRAVEPRARTLALRGGDDVTIVLQIVADDERGPMLTPPAAANALAGAESFNRRAIAEHDLVGSPDRPASGRVGKMLGQPAVFDEFRLDVFQVGAGLMFRIRDDPDERFAAFDRRAERQGQRADG